MDTKLVKIDELQSVLSNENETIRGIQQFMQPFTLGTTLKHYSQIKEKKTDILSFFVDFVHYFLLLHTIINLL